MDGRTFETRLASQDPEIDVAVLQVVGPGPFPYLEWGDEAALEVGDALLSFGNPYGVGISVSAGMLSAKDRFLAAPELNFNTTGRIAGFLQTDMMQSLGNSGGPLVNGQGMAVGMTTFILAPGQESIGLGFGVPAGILKKAVRRGESGA